MTPHPQHIVPAARVDFLPEDRQWIADRIQEVLATGHLTLGPYGTAFEAQFAAWCGMNHGVAAGSGTAALEIILRCLQVEGQEVLVPANTFFATAAAVIHAGGRPVFMDTDPETFGTAPEEVERRLTPRTAAMIVVHIGGIVSHRMPELADLAQRKGIWLVEDAAHAHGSTLHGTHAGAFGIASAFSFYPTKVMTAGEGGMVVTNDQQLAAEARKYRDQGKASFTQNLHTHLGYNWRLSEPHAIIALRHLERLPAMLAARRRIASLYDTALACWDRAMPLVTKAEGISNYYKYIVVLSEQLDRQALKAEMRERYGVSLAGEVYEEPLHKQPIFAPYAESPLPQSEDVCARHICLPIFASLTDSQAQQVIEALQCVIS